MKVLVIAGHPDTESYGEALYRAYVSGLKQTNHEVETLHLASESFDPVLRFGYRKLMESDRFIKRSQELVQWADHLVFVYPVWWSSMPSLLKGWVDRVFTPDVAFTSNNKGNLIINFIIGNQFKKLLKGKTADIITTSQGPSWWYPLWSGIISVPDSYGVAVLKSAVLNHCGIKTKKILCLGEATRDVTTPERYKRFLHKVKMRAQSL